MRLERALGALALVVALGGVARADTAGADLSPQVRALVDAWLQAQNRGDFAAYEKLYAQKFTGVRRSGTRSVSLDRAGWMRDRKRMFQKPMKVALSDIKIAAAGASARIAFTQDWESGSYHDRGPKQLVVVREADGVRIAREELLTSEKAPSATTRAANAQLALVLAGQVILDDAAEESWGTGAPSLADEGDPVVTWKRAGALPPEHKAWVGKKLVVYSPGGKRCTGKVTGLRLVSLVVPHFGMREEWKEKSAREKAAEAWELGGKMLAASLDGCDVKDALFARAAELPPLAIAAPVQADGALRSAAIKALRALPSWRAVQKSWTAQGGKGLWDVKATDADIAVERWDLPQPLITVSAHAFDGCGGFGGEVFAVFDLVDGVPKLRGEPTAMRPEAAVILDGGVPAFVGGQSWSEFATARQLVPLSGAARKIEVPFLDCPC
jgi:ketosteroid isomerase-like protein